MKGAEESYTRLLNGLYKRSMDTITLRNPGEFLERLSMLIQTTMKKSNVELCDGIIRATLPSNAW